MTRKTRRNGLLLTTALFGFLGMASGAYAADQTYQFDIPAEPLGKALNDFSQAASQQIIFSDEAVAGRKSAGLHGSYTVDQALKALLAGTDLTVETNPSGVLMVRQKKQQAAANNEAIGAEAAAAETVVVTGTRIRGAAPTSQVIEITQQDMVQAGQYTLGDVVRSIPQNFSGGQNPAVLVGATAGAVSNENDTGATTINLRGLGPDATLTLVNGQRLSYNSYSQGIDISTIPVAAIDRVEIVADGTSAIYGSDAVAGVANIILKRDFSGLSTAARLGQATEGGDFQQQYSVVAGQQWGDGGVFGAYEYGRDTAIYANQRDYTSYLTAPYMLLPPQDHHSVVFSGHQDFGSLATFSIDALFNHRDSDSVYTTPPYARDTKAVDESYTIAPKLEFNLPSSWTVSINGVFGRDAANRNRRIYNVTTGATNSVTPSCYCNEVRSAEANAEGPLFELPGGEARGVIGAGYREDIFHYKATSGAQSGSQSDTFVYSEFYFPLVSDASGVPLLRELSFTAALRHESYARIGTITTPKLGVVYAPSSDFDLKGSWGRSFKAPTLNEQLSPVLAVLYPVTTLGGVGYPSTATALLTGGGNPDLKPEHAETWTGTLDFHPDFVPGLHTELSYFSVKYTDRIIAPFATTAILGVPMYDDFVDYSPTAALAQNVVNGATGGFYNLSGSPFTPSNVVAIAYGQDVNVAAQNIDGIDANSTYQFDIGGSDVTLTNNTSYLHSTQKNNPSSHANQLAGIVYNPPNWRSRTGVSVAQGGLIISSFWNYTGGIENNYFTPAFDGQPMNTFDLVTNYTIDKSDGLANGMTLSLSVINLFDTKPPYMKNQYAYYPDYDSTNYSPVGRLISFSVSKDW